MKLELKHLSAYLPYGLKFRARGEVWEITSINTLDEFPIWAHNYWDEEKLVYYPSINRKGNFQGKGYRLSKIKPILRPLSDLKKGDLDYLINTHSTDWFSDTDIERMIHIYLSNNNLHLFIEFLPNGLVQWLIEKHFDIFGLIDQGLAIDINTLSE